MTTDMILGLAALWLLVAIAAIVRRRRRAGRRAP
jgi:LPXTG-motif cell wall-anchored protein